MPRSTLAPAALLVLASLAGAASADVIYRNDFEQGPLGAEWSPNSELAWHAGFSRFNGRYSAKGITLSLDVETPPGNQYGGVVWGGSAGTGINPIGKKKSGGDGGGGDGGGGDGGDEGGGTRYTLAFDLYLFDSWDGDGPAYGPDVLEIRANADVIFHETFSNGDKPQSFRAPDVGPVHMAYSPSWADSIYRNITVTFPHPGEASRLNITWEGIGLQGVVDESWAIDNVSLSVDGRSIPGPGVLATAALAALATAGRRRR